MLALVSSESVSFIQGAATEDTTMADRETAELDGKAGTTARVVLDLDTLAFTQVR